MNKSEKESLLKTFLLFFVSLTLLSGIIQYFICIEKRHTLEQTVFQEMMICSLRGDCHAYKSTVLSHSTSPLFRLERTSQGYVAFFSQQNASKPILKLFYPMESFDVRHRAIKLGSLKQFLTLSVFLALISFLFSIYTLSPLRRSLKLTEEFSRDIIHDLNTPLSALKLNASRLNVSEGERKKLSRILGSINTLESLGANLRNYLDEQPIHHEPFHLRGFLDECIETIERLYPSIRFSLQGPDVKLTTDRSSFKRIVENLLSNAGKYNTPDGFVEVTIDPKGFLSIRDSGKGIAHPDKVFERFYKEHDRGLGIGLHIVKKLCDLLHVSIHVESQLNRGSLFQLDLRSLLNR